MTEKETYLASIKSKGEFGLKDVKFYPANTFDISEDSVYAELNRLHASNDLPDREVLGDHSPAN